MDDLAALQWPAVTLPLLPVGLETDDLILQVLLLPPPQGGGDLTLPMLWGLDMGDFMTLSGLVSGGEPTVVLDSTGLHVMEFLR